jgi:hypothetical protein
VKLEPVDDARDKVKSGSQIVTISTGTINGQRGESK